MCVVVLSRKGLISEDEDQAFNLLQLGEVYVDNIIYGRSSNLSD